MVEGVFLGVLCAFVPAWVNAGDLTVVINAPTGKSIASGMLIVERQSIPLTDGGKKLVQGLPDKRIAVTVDALIGNEGTRYLGVTEAKTLPDKTVDVTVTLQPVTELDAFCIGCHPSTGQTVKANQILRDIHVSGKELTERYLAQVKTHNENVELQRKNKTPNPPLTIPLEERVVKVGDKEVKKYFYTCESCHTTHLKTVWSKYMRASYSQPSTLCLGCHF